MGTEAKQGYYLSNDKSVKLRASRSSCVAIASMKVQISIREEVAWMLCETRGSTKEGETMSAWEDQEESTE